MHGRLLLDAVHHPAAQYIGGVEETATYLLAQVAPDDIVITLAGDGNRVGQLVLAGLLARDSRVSEDREERMNGGGPEHTTGRSTAVNTDNFAQLIRPAAVWGVAVAARDRSHATLVSISGPAPCTRRQRPWISSPGWPNWRPSTASRSPFWRGSNVLVSDAGVRGLVIANQDVATANWRFPNSAAVDTSHPPIHPHLIADSGVLLAGLAGQRSKRALPASNRPSVCPARWVGRGDGNAGATVATSPATWSQPSSPIRARAGGRSPRNRSRSPIAAACSNASWPPGKRSRWC